MSTVSLKKSWETELNSSLSSLDPQACILKGISESLIQGLGGLAGSGVVGSCHPSHPLYMRGIPGMVI